MTDAEAVEVLQQERQEIAHWLFRWKRDGHPMTHERAVAMTKRLAAIERAIECERLRAELKATP